MNANFTIEEGTCIGIIRGYKLIKLGPYLFLLMSILNIVFFTPKTPFAFNLLFPSISSFQASIIDWVWVSLNICSFLLFMFSGFDGNEIYYYTDGLYYNRAIHFRNSSSERLPQIKFDSTTKSFYLKRKKYNINPLFKVHSQNILDFLEAKQNKEWSQEFKDFNKWTFEIHWKISGEILKRVDSLLKDVIAGKNNKTKKEFTEINFYQFKEKVYMEVLEKFSDLIHSYQNDENFKSDLNLLEKQLREEIYKVLDAVILETIHNSKSDFDASI